MGYFPSFHFPLYLPKCFTLLVDFLTACLVSNQMGTQPVFKCRTCLVGIQMGEHVQYSNVRTILDGAMKRLKKHHFKVIDPKLKSIIMYVTSFVFYVT